MKFKFQVNENCTICGDDLSQKDHFEFCKNDEGTGHVCFKHTCKGDPHEITYNYPF